MTGLLDRVHATGFAQGHHPGRRPRRRWLVLGAALAVLLVAWLIGYSSVFGVRTVTVTGEHRVSEQQITAAADIRHGAALARLDTGAIRDRIAAIPAVRSVSVRTAFPSTVRIQVTERVPVGYRPSPDGAVLVDGANVQFATVPHAPAGLPALEVTGDQQRSAAAATVAAALPTAFVPAVARIAVPTLQTITLTLTDGRTVLWGGTDRSAEKAELVPVLVHQPGRYFDVSDPSAVISRGN